MSIRDLRDQRRARELAATGRGRAIRQAHGASLTALAGLLATAPSTVSRWERNLRSPSGDAGRRWVRLLDQLERDLTGEVQR